MMMLLLRPHGTRRNGQKRRVPVVRERDRRYGRVLDERVLSVTRDLLISGPHASGKSRWLDRLFNKAPEVWGSRPILYLRTIEPLQRWYEDPRVIASVEKRGQVWNRLKTYERSDELIRWVTESKAIVMMDDAHKLAGRKLDVATRVATNANQLVVSCFDEQQIPISLRLLLVQRKPQRVLLESKAAYDATSMALWLSILIALMAGWWQLAGVLGGMKVLAGGKRAAKQS